MFSYQLLASVVTALGALLTAIFTQFLAARRSKEKERAQQDIDKLAAALQTEEASRRSAILEAFAQRLPVGLSSAQVSELVDQITAKIAQLVPEPAKPHSEVEGLINNYHEQALGQARAQFWFSVVAATVGFAWILYGGAGISPEKLATVSKILPGVVMDSVAFLFFRQASETRQRATELYDRLRRDKQATEAVVLVASIEDLKVRSAVKAQIALQLAGLQPSPIDLSSFLSTERQPAASVVKGPGLSADTAPGPSAKP
jgi:hypothetical protein